jgi:hypothetical protein
MPPFLQKFALPLFAVPGWAITDHMRVFVIISARQRIFESLTGKIVTLFLWLKYHYSKCFFCATSEANNS